MTDPKQPATDRLTSEELVALKASAHRQLARTKNKRDLSPHQRAQRAALARAARILANRAFADGCELRAIPGEESPNV